MPDREPAVPAVAAEPEELTRRLLILDITGRSGDVGEKLAAVRDFAGRLGITAVHEGFPLYAMPEPFAASEVLTTEAEAELFTLLDQNMEMIMRRHMLGSDQDERPSPPSAKAATANRITNALHNNGIVTLRDLLVVGSLFVADIRNVGKSTHRVIRDAVAAELGSINSNIQWLEDPKPRDVARLCSNLSQIKGLAVGYLDKKMNVEQLVELGHNSAQAYAAAFRIARWQITQAREKAEAVKHVR